MSLASEVRQVVSCSKPTEVREVSECSVKDSVQSPMARAAFQFLLSHNQAYAATVREHELLVQSGFPKGRKIPTYALLMKMPGVEAAARPWLYPQSGFNDTDLRERLRELGLSGEKQQLSVRASFLRKALSRCKAYSEDFMLAFLIYDVAKAKQVVSICNVADRQGVTAEVISDHYVGSEAYWRHEQDILSDVVRIMRKRHYDDVNYPELRYLRLAQKARCRSLRDARVARLHGQPVSTGNAKAIYYPNIFVTIAPSEERVRKHTGMFAGYTTNDRLGSATGPLCLHLDTVFKKQLPGLPSPFFGHIYEWALRVEFQGRGTLHVHLAMWALLKEDYVVAGRMGYLFLPFFV